MRILILGGSHFVGRATAEVALGAGHEVTVLNRGVSGRQPHGSEILRADRTDHDAVRSAVSGRSWDWVLDTWSGAPAVAGTAASLLGPATVAYAYVSSRSVYRWPIPHHADEQAPLVEADADDTESTDYARAKRGGELAVLRARPDALLARAGLILGPYEDIGRLPWWLSRIALGGRVLAPGPPDRALQYIDARDLGRWMLSCAERQIGGPFNAVSAPGHASMGALLEAAIEVTGSDVELVWASPEQIAEAGLEPWTELPIWLPPTGEIAALHDGDVRAALATGLQCRPVSETVADTWAWMQAEGGSSQRADRPSHGISEKREAEVLAVLDAG